MRHILHGFTMHLDGLDFGMDCEEVTLPIPTPMTQEYRGGGMDMAVAQPMGAIEALEVTVKMAGMNPDILGRMGLGPDKTTRVTFRGAVLEERNGVYRPHVCFVEGSLNGGSRDTWQRGEKSGVEAMINGIIYFRYEVGDRIVHELQHFPPKRVVNGVNQLAGINRALGFAA